MDVFYVCLAPELIGRSLWRTVLVCITGEGLYEAHPCTSTADTICDACSNQHLHAANGDYDRKCRDWAASQQRNLLAAGAVVHASKSHAETRTSRLHDADAAPLDLDDADDVDGDEEGDNDGEGGRRRHRDRDRSRDRDRHRDRHRDRSVATRYDDSRSGVEKLPPATGDVFTHEFTQIDEGSPLFLSFQKQLGFSRYVLGSITSNE